MQTIFSLDLKNSIFCVQNSLGTYLGIQNMRKQVENWNVMEFHCATVRLAYRILGRGQGHKHVQIEKVLIQAFRIFS